MSHGWRRVLGVAGLAALLAGCFIDVETPRPGAIPVEPQGKVLVFGRVRTFGDDGVEYRPWSRSLEPAPALHLMLLRLGPREVAPGMPFASDGRFHWWLSPGDYALVGNSHDVHAGTTSALQMQDMHVLSVFRVPRAEVPVYVGELVLELLDVDVHSNMTMHFTFGRALVADRLDEALEAFSRSYAPPQGPHGVLLMCAGEGIPAFSDPGLFARSAGLLDTNCHAGAEAGPASPK